MDQSTCCRGPAKPASVRRASRPFNPAFALLCTVHEMRACPSGVMLDGELIDNALLDRFLAAWRLDDCAEAAGCASGVTRRLRRIGVRDDQLRLVLTVLVASLVAPEAPRREAGDAYAR